MRKKRSIINPKSIIILAIIIIVLINVPDYILNILQNDNIPVTLKEETLMNAKDYFTNNPSSHDEITLEELIDRGYINETTLDNYGCNAKSSSITRIKVETNKYKYHLQMFCDNQKSELTLSE